MKTIIDIGTNTILMLIADFNYNTRRINTIVDMLRIPRIGKGVDSKKNISPESIERAVTVLNAYKKISLEAGSKEIIAAGTSFLRDARNKDEFISSVRERTGIEVEILSGEDEARWSFWGADFEGKDSPPGLIDIGGGSTEITIGENIPGQIDREVLYNLKILSVSINVGSVRIKEKFLDTQPPSAENVKQAEQYINEQLKRVPKINESSLQQVIGVAGTITTLGALKLGLKSFEKEKVENVLISVEETAELFKELRLLDASQIKAKGDYMNGREDIILSGTLILKTVMSKYGIRNVIVSTKGLRYGIFLREIFK